MTAMIALVAKSLAWEKVLIDGYEPLRRGRRVFNRLPRDPRCRMWELGGHPTATVAVNVASRLQSYASVGEAALAAELYELIEGDHPGARRSRVEVRGREEPMDIAVLST